MTTPFFSIIVPTFDRQEALTACVQAIRQLDYPRDRFEVIIVDDGSPVPVKVSDPHPGNGVMITVLRQINAGPASARNMGAQHAQGDILVFTDDDCTPTRQWLRGLSQSFNNGSIGLVGGRTINGLVDNLYSTASQIIVDEAYAYFLSRDSDLRFFASNNIAVATELFHKIGGFDSSFRISEDRDFCYRWIRQGKPLIYAPEAIVHHHHHLTMTAFCRQHFNYGRGAYQFYRTRARCGPSLLKPDPRFYVSVFRRAIFTRKPFYMVSLMGLWQLANLAGFLWEGVYSHFLSTNLTHRERFEEAKGASRETRSREKRQD